jgi:hypothetical protein
MPSIRYSVASSLLAILLACSMGSAQTPVRQPICDSEGFLDFAQKAEQLRVKRLLSEADFAKAARDENTVVLDARGDGSFESLRVKGSKNLPYTSFSEKTLQEIIPNRSTRILIYCRNNILSCAPESEKSLKKDRHPYPDELGRDNVIKAPKVALNVPTYITLMVYGYENIWQLDAVVDPNNTPLEFESKWPDDPELDLESIINSEVPK